MVADAKALGFDGVVLDDVNDGGQMQGHLSGATIASYPSPDQWTQATTSFMAYVGPALQAQVLLVLPNIAIADWWTSGGVGIWDTWLSYSSGAIQEYYSKWSRDSQAWFTDDGNWHNDWSYRQAFLKRTQAAGKIFMGITYAPANDTRSMRYARASFLSDWSGGPSALIYEPTNPEAQDPYADDWTQDIGTPLAPRFKVGVVWQRNYTSGIVLVNPSPSSAQTVSLGATYIGPDGSRVSSVTVPATDAIILRVAAGGLRLRLRRLHLRLRLHHLLRLRRLRRHHLRLRRPRLRLRRRGTRRARRAWRERR